MTRVCLVGSEDVTLQYELLSRETSREALATYDLYEPFENAVGVETVSLGAAVALLNDLDWYLTRFVDEAMVLEPSVSDDEWLSRALATAVRDDELGPEESGRYLKIYGVVDPVDGGDEQNPDEPADDAGSDRAEPPRLVEPMYVTRTGGALPTYDLREVAETVVERVTEDEFGA